MKPRLFVTILALASLVFMSTGGCATVPQNGPTTQPVTNTPAYLAAQVNHWQAVVDAATLSLETLPPGSKRDAMLKQLNEARWWLNWFSLALAAASVPA